MKHEVVLVTGAGGLIGSEAARYHMRLGNRVIGIDNNMRRNFFGQEGDTSIVIEDLSKNSLYVNYDCDIRDKARVREIFELNRPSAVIHTAAQPSHDLAAKIPHQDFEVNAVGTLNVLEAARNFCKDSPFIHVSTNKVYGDTPNRLPLVELKTRYDYRDEINENGINEKMSIDQTTHSLFGVSKAAGDLLAQEYGRYFNMPVGIFRGGCLTGPGHASVELHGFLSYIVKCAVKKRQYTVFGYRGKQVRDQIHSYDVCTAFHEFMKHPGFGEVYNIGGCRQNSASILEVADLLKTMGYPLDIKFTNEARVGDHICYMTDMTKFKSHYPKWSLTYDLETIMKEIVESSLTCNQK